MWLIFCFFVAFFILGKQRKVSEYYKKQERLLEGFNEMETMAEKGCWPGSLTEVAHSVVTVI